MLSGSSNGLWPIRHSLRISEGEKALKGLQTYLQTERHPVECAAEFKHCKINEAIGQSVVSNSKFRCIIAIIAILLQTFLKGRPSPFEEGLRGLKCQGPQFSAI